MVVICFQISIFAESYTLLTNRYNWEILLWFAFKLVSLQSHIHLCYISQIVHLVVICFQISIFAESYTLSLAIYGTTAYVVICFQISIFAESYTLQSFFYWAKRGVVICFQISIFAESYTLSSFYNKASASLWFAFKLVSLQSHIHFFVFLSSAERVVICFQISIFAESYTLWCCNLFWRWLLWFAFKLVSLQSHIHSVKSVNTSTSGCDLLSN